MSDKDSESQSTRNTDIAIIGVGGRFPGAANCDQFWENIRDGVSAVRQLSDESLLAAGVSPAELSDPNYVKSSPVLDDIDKFDAAFFGMSPRDASVMDPAHRIFLEVAWEAIENSGNAALPEEGAVGVFAGAGAPLYWMLNVRTQPDLMRSMGEFLVRHTGNDMNFLATRVSYEFDLRGPSLNVQTACSSALVAVHLARQSLLAGECNLALAGGSTILVPSGHGYVYKEGEILSPDGHCRPFDANSAGTVFGSGAGCLVLKRLEDALDNGDNILAVIKGTAINNDGSIKVGYLAPSVEGQAAVISAALRDAGVPAESIQYVEAHGTGTLVGDPIELTGLQQAFGEHTSKKQFCGVGSVKSNIGHLGEAAAAASLIKVIYALKHRQLPPSLGYQRPNPSFDFADSAFFVNERLRPWTAAGPLRCGITALGAGGTNCHVILEEPPAAIPGEGERDVQLLVLSAKSKPALERMSENLALALEKEPKLDLADVAYTLSLGRRAFPQRRAIAVKDAAEAIRLLRNQEPQRVVSGVVADGKPQLVFTFPGGGAQYARMGLGLYESDPTYREVMDECLSIIGGDLKQVLFAPPSELAKANEELKRPSRSLPALFATEYALARTFLAWGVRPVAFVGHSMGEYTAACLAGVFSLKDGLHLVMTRGRLFETVAKGGMVGVPLSPQALGELLPEGLSIAAVNAPDLCVASGPVELTRKLEALLTSKGIDWTPIHIEVAAHSSMLEPILAEFREVCSKIQFGSPRIPCASNLTGTWLTDAQAKDPNYWVAHLRNTVQFAACAELAMSAGDRIFLEIGPGRTLTTLVQAQQSKAWGAVNSLRHPQETASDLEIALRTLGKVWALGGAVDWTAFFDGQLRNRVALPTYSFERTSFWVNPGIGAARNEAAGADTKRTDLNTWFSTLAWAPVARTTAAVPAATQWLVFLEDNEFAEALVQSLSGTVVTVRPGAALRRSGQNSWELNPSVAEHYSELLETLEGYGLTPNHVVYTWSLNAPDASESDPEALAERTFFQPVYLARAMGALLDSARLTFITSGAVNLMGEHVQPSNALVLGPLQVAPREFPSLETRLIDVVPERRSALAPERFLNARKLGRLMKRNNVVAEPSAASVALARDVALELQAEGAEQLVALRAGQRWVRRVLPLSLPESSASAFWLRQGSTVLVTGGLGGIGLAVAAHLARNGRAKLALLSRSAFAPRAEWEELASSGGTRAHLAQRLLEIESSGAQVMVVAGDVADRESLKRALTETRARFGSLNGVIHAAGVMDDAPMQGRTREELTRVLSAKVRGTLNLDAAITEPLEFFVVFSSVASLLGLPGQVDYSAANAFLDAFAVQRSQRAAGRTLAINWNAWRGVGMVEKALHPAGEVAGVPCRHPALGRFVAGKKRTYLTDFRVADQWLLNEHRIRGSFALIPGTGLLELARAAFCEAGGDVPVELSNVTFVAPFQVEDGATRRLKIEVSQDGEIVMTSGADEQLHLTATARLLSGPSPASQDLAALRARCALRQEHPKDRFLEQDFVDFGPRWANIAQISWGQSEALIECALSPAFQSDLDGYVLHPALLDMATGAAQRLLPGFAPQSDFYVPFGYERTRVHQRLPQRFFSHVRCLPDSGGALAYFDATLVDEQGSVLAEISRFTMKKVSADNQVVAAAPQSQAGAAAETAGATAVSGQRADALLAVLRTAITPEEGLAAFDRAMASGPLPQIVVSSVDVVAWRAQLDSAGTQSGADGDAAGPLFQRPDLAEDYVEPQGTLEQSLAGIWSKLLGVEKVGATDDFFALGGNSLVAVRLFARIKKDFSVSLPISALYQASNVRALALLIAEADPKLQTVAAEAAVFVSHRELVQQARANRAHEPAAEAPRETVYEWVWRAAPLATPPATARKETWLVFLDDAGVGAQLCRRLRKRGDTVIQVYDGDAYHKLSDAEYSVSPEQGRGGFDQLLADLKQLQRWPDHVVMLWSISLEESFRPGSNFFHRTQERGFFSLLFFAQALADQNVTTHLSLTAVTNGAFAVRADDVLYPSKNTILGPSRAIGRELPFVRSRAIDVALAPLDGQRGEQPEAVLSALAGAVESEVLAAGRDERIALRQMQRYVCVEQPVAVPSTEVTPTLAGTYLVTVGRDDVGVHIVHALACLCTGQLVVLLPGRAGVAIDVDDAEVDVRLVPALVRLRQDGRKVMICRAEISNVEQMQAVKSAAERRFGAIQGVFHAASEIEGIPMQLQTPEETDRVLAPQVQGTQVLVTLFAERNLDFVAYCAALEPWADASGQASSGAGAAFFESLVAAGGAGATQRLARRNLMLLLGPNEGGELTLLPELSTRQAARLLNQVTSGADRTVVLSALSTAALEAQLSTRRDAAVSEPAGARPAATEPSSDAERQLRTIWGAATGWDAVDAELDLRSAGVGELGIARVMTHVRVTLGLRASVTALCKQPTVRAVLQLLEQERSASKVDQQRFKHVVAIHPGAAIIEADSRADATGKLPFFLVAGMYGNILNLRHLGHLVGHDREVYGIQARGLLGNEEPHETLEGMAEAYLEEVRRLQPSGPYALGGFSGGGLTALEMAKQLKAQGEQVALLVMLDTPTPERDKITAQDRAMVQWLRLKQSGPAYVSEWARNRIRWEMNQLQKRFKPASEEYAPHQFKHDEIGAAFIRATQRYTIPAYDSKVTLFRPQLDQFYRISADRYLTRGREVVLEDNGWGKFARSVEVFEVPGDHDSMVLEPGVRVLAERLRSCLQEAEAVALAVPGKGEDVREAVGPSVVA